MSTISGLLLIVVQPPYSFAVGAWFALVPLLLALPGKRGRQRLLLGLVCGSTWAWGLVGVWLQPAVVRQLGAGGVTAFAVSLAGVEIYGGLYVMAFAWWYPARPGRFLPAWLSIPARWIALEFLRACPPFGAPWGLLGHSQYEQTTLIQLADLTGVYGVSFILVAGNVAVTEFIVALRQRRRPRDARAGIAAVTLLLAATLAYGHWRLNGTSVEGDTIRVQAVHTAWSDTAPDAPQRLLARLIELTEAMPAGADVIIWPENSLRSYMQEQPDVQARITALVERRRAPLLAGGPRYRHVAGSYTYYNSAFLFAPGEPVVAVYDKRLLVPLAEARLPGLPSVARPFTPGQPTAPLSVGAARLGVLICFESIFPQPARELVRAGATLLVNLTNDELLDRGAAQQAAMSTFRAVENRVPLVRVANLGPTYLVDALGRVKTAASEGAGSIVTGVPRRPGPTLYTRWGDAFAVICIIVAVSDSLGLSTRLRTPVRR